MNSLLPPNATGAERALALAPARISDVPVPVDTLWNPHACPAELLPWLAWALSVDIWDSEWSEAAKRAAIAESVAIHRRKGTTWASREALRRVLPDAVLSEWHQYGGAPYCYRIDTSGGLIDHATFANRLIPSIHAAKNARSHLDRITVRRQLTGNLDLKWLVVKSDRRLTIRPRLALDFHIRAHAALVPMTFAKVRIAARQ